jgi:hypothetical protein
MECRRGIMREVESWRCGIHELGVRLAMKILQLDVWHFLQAVVAENPDAFRLESFRHVFLGGAFYAPEYGRRWPVAIHWLLASSAKRLDVDGIGVTFAAFGSV